jgi:PAS domain S-box-containing protein
MRDSFARGATLRKRREGEERKRAEEQLATSAQELKRTDFYLSNAQGLGHIGNWTFNPASGFEYWSHELFQIHGLDHTRGAPNSEQYLALVHPRDRDFMAALIARMLSDDSTFDVTKRIVRANGEVRNVRCVGSPVYENGVSKRIGIGIDVTEQEVLTQELRRHEACLAAAQRLSRTGSFGWKPNSNTIVWSAETYRIFEFDPPAEITLDAMMSRVHPEDREIVQVMMRRASGNHTGIDFKHRLVFPGNRIKYVRVLAQPLQIESDEVEFAGAVIDITGENRAEETRIKLDRASRIATVAELSASIAHELNQPLMSILANAQAAKKWFHSTPPNSTAANSSIERIIRDARAADEAMQHIRALFKQEPSDKKATHILPIVRDAVQFVQEIPRKREIPIECHFEEPLPVVLIDPIQIQHVFINLIVNALEALEGDQATPMIILRAAKTQANEVLIQVMDNGPGIKDPERIFDAFMTTKEKGMGIGLAVSRSIIDAHAGRLWAENNPDGGATFNVALPLSRELQGRFKF